MLSAARRGGARSGAAALLPRELDLARGAGHAGRVCDDPVVERSVRLLSAGLGWSRLVPQFATVASDASNSVVQSECVMPAISRSRCRGGRGAEACVWRRRGGGAFQRIRERVRKVVHRVDLRSRGGTRQKARLHASTSETAAAEPSTCPQSAGGWRTYSGDPRGLRQGPGCSLLLPARGGPLDAVDGRVAQVHVRARHVDLEPHDGGAVLHLPRRHRAEERDALLHRPIACGTRPGRVTARALGPASAPRKVARGRASRGRAR